MKTINNSMASSSNPMTALAMVLVTSEIKTTTIKKMLALATSRNKCRFKIKETTRDLATLRSRLTKSKKALVISASKQMTSKRKGSVTLMNNQSRPLKVSNQRRVSLRKVTISSSHRMALTTLTRLQESSPRITMVLMTLMITKRLKKTTLVTLVKLKRKSKKTSMTLMKMTNLSNKLKFKLTM